MNGPTRRLFIGLLPDDAVRRGIVEHQQLWFWAGHRRMPAARLHLTLHFLGYLDATQERSLRDALAAEDVAPFDLILRTPELWSEGIAVLRADEHAALFDLHERLAERLLETGLLPQRGRFNPHVTLARNAPRAAPPEGPRPIAWTVKDFALLWSREGPPATYEVLDRYGST